MRDHAAPTIQRDTATLRPVVLPADDVDWCGGRPISAEGLPGGSLAAAVLDALPDATAVLNGSGSIVAINRAWHMFAIDNGGEPGSTGVGANYLEICDRASGECHDALLAARAIRHVLAGDMVQSELEYPCPSASADRWFLLRVTRLAGHGNGVVASHVNITRRKRIELALEHEAAHDPLTGLANRTLFNTRLVAALTARVARPLQADVGVLYVDLDNFKQINDKYGHDAGDEVLVVTAQRLSSRCRLQDTIARLGGDEFGIITPRTSSESLATLVSRLSLLFEQPHLIHGDYVRIACSIGTHLAIAGEIAADALSEADRAMYAAKRSLRARRK
jgi:diguanylate cyclase (GGDEF)-like protein